MCNVTKEQQDARQDIAKRVNVKATKKKVSCQKDVTTNGEIHSQKELIILLFQFLI